MARFERVNLAPAEWDGILRTFADRIVHQSPAYLAFLAETQNAEPVVAALKEGNDTLGYFTGLIFRKFGLKILGSPFRGWSTPYMGFNLQPSVHGKTPVFEGVVEPDLEAGLAAGVGIFPDQIPPGCRLD